MKCLPILDTAKTIPVKPTSVRYVTHGFRVWAIASSDNQDYATCGIFSRKSARDCALKYGVMFLVRRWAAPPTDGAPHFDY